MEHPADSLSCLKKLRKPGDLRNPFLLTRSPEGQEVQILPIEADASAPEIDN